MSVQPRRFSSRDGGNDFELVLETAPAGVCCSITEFFWSEVLNKAAAEIPFKQIEGLVYVLSNPGTRFEVKTSGKLELQITWITAPPGTQQHPMCQFEVYGKDSGGVPKLFTLLADHAGDAGNMMAAIAADHARNAALPLPCFGLDLC